MVLYLKEGKKDAIMSFGEKLSYFKKRKGLSDHEIGMLIGASDKAVYGFESLRVQRFNIQWFKG